MPKVVPQADEVTDLAEGLDLKGGVLITSAPKLASVTAAPTFEILRRIREDIISGVFKPDERLKFDDLRERYSASIGTLRESLLQLLSEGFVRSETNRGFTVASVSAADIMDVTRLRIKFEREALEDAIHHGDDHWEAEIVTSMHLLQKLIADNDKPTHTAEWPTRHRRFHNSLVAACRSPWLLHFRETLFDHAERYRSLGRIYRKSPRDVGAEHQALADAVLSRNIEVACDLGEQHILGTVENVVKNVPGLKNTQENIPKKSSGL